MGSNPSYPTMNKLQTNMDNSPPNNACVTTEFDGGDIIKEIGDKIARLTPDEVIELEEYLKMKSFGL